VIFPAGHQVKSFRPTLSTGRTDYIVTNAVAQDWTPATQDVWGWRPKIGEATRRARIVRNHIGCATLVRVRRKQAAC
jgi:hypothetical protein